MGYNSQAEESEGIICGPLCIRDIISRINWGEDKFSTAIPPLIFIHFIQIYFLYSGFYTVSSPSFLL